ncbi:MAG: glycosyltransferase family 39 protein [Candidatus Hydrothermarchaeales archaeon]
MEENRLAHKTLVLLLFTLFCFLTLEVSWAFPNEAEDYVSSAQMKYETGDKLGAIEDFNKAAAAYEETNALGQALHYRDIVAHIYVELAQEKRKSGDDLSAVEYYLEALPIYRRMGYTKAARHYRGRIAFIYAELGEKSYQKKDYLNAYRYYGKASQFYRSSMDSEGFIEYQSKQHEVMFKILRGLIFFFTVISIFLVLIIRKKSISAVLDSILPLKILYPLLLALLTFSLLVPFSFKCGLSYDGGLYASLGSSLVNNREYSFNSAPGDVAPVFPILLAVMLGVVGEKGIYLLTVLIATVLVLTVYFILNKKISPQYAFIGSLLFFSIPLIYKSSVYVLRDIPVLMFVMICYLIYEDIHHHNRQASRHAYLVLGVFMALAFMTKYIALLYILPIIFHGLVKREKPLALSLITGILIMLPWSVWSLLNHGTPLVEHSTRYLSHISVNIGEFLAIARPSFNTWPLHLFLVLAILEILREFKFKKGKVGTDNNLYVLLLVLTILPVVMWPIKVERYILAAFFPVIYLGMRFLDSLTENRLVALVLLIGVLSQIVIATNSIEYYACPKYILLEDAGHWLRENTPENSRIMTQSFRQINFFAQRPTYPIPSKPSDADRIIEDEDITHILIDSYEFTTPDYAHNYFDKYEVSNVFLDSYGGVVIYKVS